MITEVHIIPEGSHIFEGINLGVKDVATDFRLIYRSPSTSFYFRIRSDTFGIKPKYIFSWEL